MDIVIWSIVEVYSAIICASLISIRPLIAKIFPRLFPTTRTTESRSKTRSPAWPGTFGSRISGKFRSNHGTELLSENDTILSNNSKVATKISVADIGSDVELSERNLSFRNAHLEEEFQHRPK